MTILIRGRHAFLVLAFGLGLAGTGGVALATDSSVHASSAKGFSGLEIVRVHSEFREGISSGATAACPSGKKLLGGGAQTVRGGLTNAHLKYFIGAPITQSMPDPSGAQAWVAYYRDPTVPGSGIQWKIIVSAICAQV